MTVDNLVKFAAKPREEPALAWEFHLDEQTLDISIRVVDDAGRTVDTIPYRLASWPEGLDADRFLGAWRQWRGEDVAS